MLVSEDAGRRGERAFVDTEEVTRSESILGSREGGHLVGSSASHLKPTHMEGNNVSNGDLFLIRDSSHILPTCILQLTGALGLSGEYLPVPLDSVGSLTRC